LKLFPGKEQWSVICYQGWHSSDWDDVQSRYGDDWRALNRQRQYTRITLQKRECHHGLLLAGHVVNCAANHTHHSLIPWSTNNREPSQGGQRKALVVVADPSDRMS
jgi:hypothetical protein